MTAPALLVLFLAHVCSTFGTVSGPTADYDNKLTNKPTMGYHTTNSHLNRWTNYHKNHESNSNVHVDKISNELYKYEVNNKLNVRNNKIDVIYDELYEESPDDTRSGVQYDKIFGKPEDHKYNVKTINKDSISMKNEDTSLRIFDGHVKKRSKRDANNDDDGRSKRDANNDDDGRSKRDANNDDDGRSKRDANNDDDGRSKRDANIDKCALFKEIDEIIQHPHPNDKKNTTYYKNANCVTTVEAEKNQVIELTFIDQFEIEYHKDCNYDYLEIRDGIKGYAKLLGRLCGNTFPSQIQTSGPYAWLKFKSDDTIEYNGFKIQVKKRNGPGGSPPEACYLNEIGKRHGVLSIDSAKQECNKGDDDLLDILWYIETTPKTKIYLNFTKFVLQAPNECELNIVEVFGNHPETDNRLVQYCGSIANAVQTKDEKDNNKEPTNVMHVRLFVAPSSRPKTKFEATYIAYRMLNPNDPTDVCDSETEFDCDDNTCIAKELHCSPDGEAHCRLKTDEDPEDCHAPAANTINQPHILVILVIFSLILSAMSFVFLYKCIKKLVEDHKIIKEHIRESCEDRLDVITSHLTLDAKQLQRESEPRASLERDNRANEMYKRHRDSFSKRKPSSIDSEYMQETHLDNDVEPWRRETDIPEAEVRIERNGRSRHSQKERHDRRCERGSERKHERRSDVSRKEESIRSKREPEEPEKKEIRDASVGPPDTKESSCQTRESLFQADAPPSSDGSGTTGTNSRGFSTFGYSGATIARPSPPAARTSPPHNSEITIELLRQVPRQDSVIPLKKLDRRPTSTETTRSAPDVIIVSKPIR